MTFTKRRAARALPAGLAAAAMTAALAAVPTTAHADTPAQADTSWTVRKAPFTLGTSGLNAVTAAGYGAVWAGGYQWQNSYVPPYCGEIGPCSPRYYQNPVLQGGDGASWSWIGTPGMTGAGQITALDAVSATDVWAAGPHDRSDGGGCGTPYLARLSGGAWEELSAPLLTCFYALDADGAGAWAAGYADRAHGGSAVYRWTGGIWRPQDTGAVEVRAIRQRTPDDVWAVGAEPDLYGEGRFYAARFDGSAWHDMTPPQLAGRYGRLTGVLPLGADDVWAVSDAGAHHWDGSAWQSPPAPVGVRFTGPLEDDGAGGAWAIGARRNAPEGSVLLHYTGGAWRTELETTAVVKGLARVPGTRTMWAVGALAGKPYVLSAS
ncbi:hypothetical protein [Actinomadura sp. NPDC048394]|uniref:hypothetical protein n=1 Tax=Actinomadura sp. NPDC048394 TaxID=3158223 RepID=UPI003401368E